MDNWLVICNNIVAHFICSNNIVFNLNEVMLLWKRNSKGNGLQKLGDSIFV